MKQVRPVRHLLVALAVAALALVVATGAASAQTLSPEVLKAFTFRSIGPTPQGGRFTDFAVPELEPWTIYAATGSGGLWKSEDNGVSWAPIFDNQPVISIGDIAVAATNPKILYVGTGEGNMSRSMYHGDGIYKTTDGGKTWTNVGLKDSHHIGRIVVHPKNPDIVYVAAQGHLYSENDERGVFKTIDGGKTWSKSLDVKIEGRAIGAADIVIDPKTPDTLYASTYDRERKPWTFNLGGPGSAIYKTVNGGKSWTKLTGGLPGGMLGRIGLDIYLRNPLILYANIEDANKPDVSEAERLKELREGRTSAGMLGAMVYRTDDGGKTWRKVSPEKQNVGGGPGYYYMDIRVDPNDANHVYVLSVGVQESKDGGKTWATGFDFGGDNHALWIDPVNSKHMLLGYDHGMGVTWDAGRNWLHPDNQPLGQFYAIGLDNQMPYNVYGGMQDNGSSRGPSSKRGGRPIVFEDWQSVGGGDGFFNVVDPVTHRYLYNESQFGAIQRVDLYTGERKGIRHQDPALRFNWNAPILISPHDSNTIYHASNKLLKSISRGDSWVEISPDLTTNDKTKLLVPPPPGVPKGGDGNIEYCTITSIDESSIQRDLIYVGTDDGNVWITKDGGRNGEKSWTKLNDKIKGQPGYWVSRVIASSHFPGTAYVTYTGYRNDDFRPFVFKTTDYGETWTSIASNLPNKAINVIREDPKNPNLLFIGADFGLYVSIDGGRSWHDMQGNMPTQPVYDLQIHPRDGELVVATHGRSIFITDITPLQQLANDTLGRDLVLFNPKPAVKWITRIEKKSASDNYAGRSAPNGLVIHYYQKAAASGSVVVQIMKGARVIAEKTDAPNAAGFNRVVWNLTGNIVMPPAPAGQAARAGGFRRGVIDASVFGGAVPVMPGEFTVVIKAGGKTLSTSALVLEDVWFDKTF